jgi:zinc protease
LSSSEKCCAGKRRRRHFKIFWRLEGRRTEKPNTLFPPAPTNSVSVTHVPDASRVQDKITLAETLQLTRTNEDYYALQLGNHVLGGGFYATRLYRDLREKAGWFILWIPRSPSG